MTDAELDARLGELLVSSKALDSSRVDTAKVYQQARGGTLAGAVLSLQPGHRQGRADAARGDHRHQDGRSVADDRVSGLPRAREHAGAGAGVAGDDGVPGADGGQPAARLPAEPDRRALSPQPRVAVGLPGRAAARHRAGGDRGAAEALRGGAAGADTALQGEASLDVAEAAYKQAIDAPFTQYVDGAASFANRTRDTLGAGRQGLELLAREPVIIRLVHQIIARSVEAGASDIHVEPAEGRLRVRARVDGALRVLHDLPPSVILPVTARLKAMADVPLTAATAPIDARIGYDLVWGRPVDLRFSLVPSISGEKVVMRVLDRARQRRDLGDLGVDDETRALLEEASDLPNGLLLVTGPTGSGKSSTLYALLDRLNTEDECILTAEDPVESRILGVTQVQCDAEELTYAMALRSFLRQDPDVIMVGEVRDAETADIALKAALTGHMVLSSLHTNDAAGAVLRLLNMGLESFIVASSLRLVVAQRLVRRLCKECKVPAGDRRSHPSADRDCTSGCTTTAASPIREPHGCPAAAAPAIAAAPASSRCCGCRRPSRTS